MPHYTSKEKETRLAFAALMNEGAIIESLLALERDNHKFGNDHMKVLFAWIAKVVETLNQTGLHTDAVAFAQSGAVAPSLEQQAAFNHLSNWKRYNVAQVALYRGTLQEIVKRRGL